MVFVAMVLLLGGTLAHAQAQDMPRTETTDTALWSTAPDPLQIEVMRQRSYTGSAITLEEMLAPGANYSQSVVSYQSDGYTLYALMTVPFGAPPPTGWPVIVFNHGYIAPSAYRTTERYVAYVNALASRGYIVFKSDYRGHGQSEGGPEVGGGYGTPDYTVDILNAVAALKAYPGVDPERIGMWGHSMGGQVTLRAMVVSPDIRAGVIWGGVVVPYAEIVERWDFSRILDLSPTGQASQSESGRWMQSFSGWVAEFSARYGTAEENPALWASVSPNTYLADLSGPIQLHHSTTDEMVPVGWSETLAEELQAAGQPYELFTYEGDNHNISANFNVAMQRTVAFYDAQLNGPQ
jgi:dipeptidyl aminopeptidase/acylaminoacyl peptidase